MGLNKVLVVVSLIINGDQKLTTRIREHQASQITDVQMRVSMRKTIIRANNIRKENAQDFKPPYSNKIINWEISAEVAVIAMNIR